jgi:iron complex transport system substrate-binding protein
MGRSGTTFLLFLVGLLVLAGCGSSGDAATAQGAAVEKFPMTVETCGRQVTIERAPDRVMTIGSGAPTLVWAAGAADRIDALIGVLDPLGPAAAAFEGVPMVVPGDVPSKEVLLGQDPDLLLDYGLTAISWEEVEALGLDQIVDSGQCDSPVDDGPTLDGDASFQDIYDDIELYGRIFGTEDAAARAVADLRVRVTAIEERFRDAPQRTAAVVQAYSDHLSVYGQASIGHAQLETLGLTNAFAEVEDRFIELNVEELLARDPDVLVLAHSYQVTADAAMQKLRQVPGAERLTAVREGRIIPVEGAAIIGGIKPIELLDDMADVLARFE